MNNPNRNKPKQVFKNQAEYEQAKQQQPKTSFSNDNEAPLNLSKKQDPTANNSMNKSRPLSSPQVRDDSNKKASNIEVLETSDYENSLEFRLGQLNRQEEELIKRQLSSSSLNQSIGANSSSSSIPNSSPTIPTFQTNSSNMSIMRSSSSSSISKNRPSKFSSRPSIDKVISTLNKNNLTNQESHSGHIGLDQAENRKSLTPSIERTCLDNEDRGDSLFRSKSFKPDDINVILNEQSSKKPKLSPPLPPLPQPPPPPPPASLSDQTLASSSMSMPTSNRPPILSSSRSCPPNLSNRKDEADSAGAAAAPMTIIGTVVHVVSNQVWICPWCNKPDDSVPMIGCDSCDDWYHWHCVGINREPPQNQNWYCHKCGNTDNPNAKPPKHHAHANIFVRTKSVQEAEDVLVEVEHPVDTTEDEEDMN